MEAALRGEQAGVNMVLHDGPFLAEWGLTVSVVVSSKYL